ncbi:amidohydrolase family protein [Maribacter aestuarii]|uniref:amidohydrolase family protein n=1 Tax=Maribacter aestuarii TaxID=1130723 RepID=UPI00248BFD07|nr:amidohydrolase family protein [Maribacter aestuarii]
MKIQEPLLSLILFSILILCSCSEEKIQTYDIVVRNGNIIDLQTGNMELRHIFISDGRIQKITDIDDDSSFEAKNSIDATGKYILPGFWDNHVHFRGGDSLIGANKNFLNLFMANGITTVRDAGGDLTPSVMEWKKEIKAGALTGPNIFTSGPKIDGPDPTWAGSLEVENEEDITKALDSLQSIPVDFVKLYESRLAGENYLKTIEAAEERGLITSGHMPFTVTLDETIAAGIDAIEHLYYVMKGCSAKEEEITKRLANNEMGFWDAMPALMASYQDSTAQSTFARLKNNNVYVVPSLHIGNVLSYLDEIDHSKDHYLQYMTDGIRKTYQGRINRVLNATEKAVQDRKDLDDFFVKLAKSLNDAGVGLLAGSDSGAFNSFTYPGISLHQELEALVNAGISPLEALQTSAYNGSKFLKQESDYGSVVVGKISDMVLLEANPLEDISNTKKIAWVIKGDIVLDNDGLQELLDDVLVE